MNRGKDRMLEIESAVIYPNQALFIHVQDASYSDLVISLDGTS